MLLSEIYEEYKVYFAFIGGFAIAGILWYFIRPSPIRHLPPIPENIPALQDIPQEVWKDAFKMVFPPTEAYLR